MDFRDMVGYIEEALKRAPYEGSAYDWWYNHMLPELISINETYIDCRGCIHCSIVGDKDGYMCEKNKRTAFYNITSVQGCSDYVSWSVKGF